MTHTATTTSPSTASAMGNGHKKFTSTIFSGDDTQKHSTKILNPNDIPKWTSTEVQQWIKQQCKKFELKKTTVEKFEMNGQALVLLTKHDFLRRSPEGGEILYYALQRLINPNKTNSTRADQNVLKDTAINKHPRIVEVSVDHEDSNSRYDLSSPKPIIEEPDDPPVIRKSQSDTNHHDHQREHPHPFFFSQSHMGPTVYTMPAGAAGTFFNSNLNHPQTHPQMQMHPQQMIYPHLMHQYHPMMNAQGILIEIMDDTDFNYYTPNGVINGANIAHQNQPFMVTINGQRYIMNEGQVRQLVYDAYQQQNYQQQAYQENLQQQQQRFQQQYFQQRLFPEQHRF